MLCSDRIVVEMSAESALDTVKDLLAYADMAYLAGKTYLPLVESATIRAREIMSQLEAQSGE